MPFIGKQPAEAALVTGDLGDDIVTLAKLAGGTDGNLISFDASGDPVAIATGNDGQVLHSAGAGAQPAFETLSAGYTIGTEQATTSGTAITFGSIPTGTKRIIMNLVAVSQASANQHLIVRIGTSGGIETSGYTSTGIQFSNESISQTLRITSGFAATGMVDFDAANVLDGSLEFNLEDASAFTWCYKGQLGQTGIDQYHLGAGQKSLSAELTQISLTTVSGATFDAGACNILYI